MGFSLLAMNKSFGTLMHHSGFNFYPHPNDPIWEKNRGIQSHKMTYKSPCKRPTRCMALSTNVMPEHLRFLKRCCPLIDSCKRINKSAPRGCDKTRTLWWFKWGRRKHWELLVKGFLKRLRRALKSAPSTWTDTWSGKRLLSHKILRTVYFLTCLHCLVALSSHSKTNPTHQL